MLGALIAGGASLLGTILGSVLNKPEQQKRTIGVSGFNNHPNSPIFPMFSDETTKEDIHSADDKIKRFLSASNDIEYHYKPKYEDGSGENFGLKAQDIEHTDFGRDMITKDPESGKMMVDYGPRSVEKLFAIASHINKRLEKAGI